MTRKLATHSNREMNTVVEAISGSGGVLTPLLNSPRLIGITGTSVIPTMIGQVGHLGLPGFNIFMK